MEENNVQDTSNLNANTQDTSQAFEAPVENSNSEPEVSIDDIILGQVDDSASAFGVPEGTQETTESAEPVQGEQPVANKNDDTRYEYWQSRSSKLEQELQQMKANQEQIMQQQQMAQQAQVQQAQPAPEPVEEFPPAPPRPNRPRGFNRDEAMTDPNSESARYVEDLDTWRDNMTEYTALKSQYDVAVMQEQLDNERNHRKKVEDAQRQEYQQQQQRAEIGQQVMQQYGLSEPEAVDFINEMSSNESLNMDNLVQLWRIKRGGGQPANSNPSPSPGFQQAQRAQQVPSPMGVQPAQNMQETGNVEDRIMDSMITDLNDKNPWT